MAGFAGPPAGVFKGVLLQAARNNAVTDSRATALLEFIQSPPDYLSMRTPNFEKIASPGRGTQKKQSP
ncbi:MAG: hypothetical protein ABI702_24685 [Burkholderiales bacterium]